MKKVIVCMLIAGMAISGCGKKSGSGPDNPKPQEDIIQLQRIDFDNVYHKFQYNEDEMVTRVESFRRVPNGNDMMYQFATYEYENGLPKRAEYHAQSNPEVPLYHTAKRFVYHYDAQKKLSYIAGSQTDGNNGELWKDSTDLTFNSNNQLIRSYYRNSKMNSFKEIKLNYDAAGNVLRPGYSTPIDERRTTHYSFEHAYDSKINPFRYNYLGLQLFIVFEESFFENEITLSQNNYTLKKRTEITERKNRDGVVVESNGESRTVEQTFKLDEYGSLASSDVSAFNEMLENGAVVSRAGGFSHSYKFTSVKKRH